MSPGTDQAFYRGAVAGHGRMELYLPWPAFQEHARSPAEGPGVFELGEARAPAYALAARFHPRWATLSAEARRLRARDVHQVLGRDLLEPVELVICWTPDGSVDGAGPRVDGTGQALRIAHRRGIPVLNLSRREHAAQLARCLGRHTIDDRRPGS